MGTTGTTPKIKMLLLVCMSMLLSGVSVEGTTCNRHFAKIGCYERSAAIKSELLITDLDPTHHNWGKDIDWGDFEGSLHSLACRCAAKAKGKFDFFSLGFYGECWGTSNGNAFRHRNESEACINGQFGQCDKKEKNGECVGVEDNEYFYEITSASKQATADFSQANLPGVQAKGVWGTLLDNGNLIFQWKDGGLVKMVLAI